MQVNQGFLLLPRLVPEKVSMKAFLVFACGALSLFFAFFISACRKSQAESQPQVAAESPVVVPAQSQKPVETTPVPPREEAPKPQPVVELPKIELPNIEVPKVEVPKVEMTKVSYEISASPHWTEILTLMEAHGILPIPTSGQKLTDSLVKGEVAKAPIVPETLKKFMVEAEKIRQDLAAKAKSTRGALERFGLPKDAPVPEGARTGAVPDTLLQQLFMKLMNEQKETSSPMVQAGMRLIQEWNQTQSATGASKMKREVEVPLLDVEAYKAQLGKYLQTDPLPAKR